MAIGDDDEIEGNALVGVGVVKLCVSPGGGCIVVRAVDGGV